MMLHQTLNLNNTNIDENPLTAITTSYKLLTHYRYRTTGFLLVNVQSLIKLNVCQAHN